MDETSRRPNRRRTIALVIVAVIVVAGAIVGITYLVGNTPSGTDQPSPTETTAPADPDTGEEEGDVELTPTPSQVLPEQMGGQEAIDALGDKIEFVAKRNGKTVEQLEELLLRDKSAKVSPQGFVVYIDSFENGD